MGVRLTQAAPILFGTGSLAELGNQLKMRGSGKVMIITDKGVTGAGVTAKVENVIKDAGIGCAVFDGCLSDAPSDSVTSAVKAIKEANADVIVALGGGSCMDTAKASALLIKADKPITDFIGKPPGGAVVPAGPDIPVITIPTTSGTGSEVTVVAIISDSATSVKSGIFCEGAYLAIVDPELTVDLPPQITAMTGMDVVAHAVEAICGVQRNPMSDLRGYEALRLVNAYLYDAVENGSNIAAREGMSMASSLAGLAFSDSITSLAHSVSQSLAAVIHLHHGLLCGLATPPELEVFASAVPQRVRKIGEIFGADIPADAEPELIGKIAASRLRAFMSQIGIRSLAQMGFTREDIMALTDVAMQDFMKNFSPLPITREVMVGVLESMYNYQGAVSCP